jgi:tetratricopeptide (TPR) repeat protein
VPTALFLLLAALVPLDEDPAFQAGLSAFRELKLEEAALSFQRAALDDTRPAHERARVQMWLGATYGQLGDLPRARDAFAFAFALSPDAMLPVRVSPKVVSILEEERAKARTKREAAIAERARAQAEAAASEAPPPAPPAPTPVVEPAPAVSTPAVALPPPDPAPAKPANKESAFNLLTISGGALGGCAGLLLVGGLVNGGMSLVLWQTASDPSVTQQEAVDIHGVANFAAVGAWTVAGVGLAVGAGAAGLIFLGLPE